MMASQLQPASVDEAAHLVREAAREQRTLVPCGAGSKLAWTAPPSDRALRLSSLALRGIVAYEPGDGTITARAGTPWSELAAAVEAHGHHLSPQVPDPGGATLGGVLASGQSGVERLRLGPVRHQVLGMRVLMADGTVAASGGRLVKNVTGYDVHRLHTGAHGTLGMIVEASLRLHSQPEARAIALLDAATPEASLAFARRALAPPHAPHAVLVHDLAPRESSAAYQVAVLLGARADVLPEHVRALRRDLHEARILDAEPGSGPEPRVASLWSSLAGLERASDGWPHLRVAALPGDLARVWNALAAAAREGGLELRVLVHPGIATLDAWIRPLDAASVESIAARMRAAGARVHWRGLDAHLRARVDLRGGPPAGQALMRRIRLALDPAGLWEPDRLGAGW